MWLYYVDFCSNIFLHFYTVVFSNWITELAYDLSIFHNDLSAAEYCGVPNLPCLNSKTGPVLVRIFKF